MLFVPIQYFQCRPAEFNYLAEYLWCSRKAVGNNMASRKTARIKMFALAAEICSYIPVNVIISSRGKHVIHNWLNPQFEVLHDIERQIKQSLFCA